eukprot:218991-Chlamydomonas_euryale.AAC.2
MLVGWSKGSQDTLRPPFVHCQIASSDRFIRFARPPPPPRAAQELIFSLGGPACKLQPPRPPQERFVSQRVPLLQPQRSRSHHACLSRVVSSPGVPRTQAEPRWLKLMDGGDALRLAWAARTVGHADDLLMYLLEERAATQVWRAREGEWLQGGGGTLHVAGGREA